LDAVAHIDNPHTLRLLIEQNRPVVAPVMIRPYKAWSNFWGSLTSDGFYARSMDYMDIIQNTRRLVVTRASFRAGCLGHVY
jgi:procollagen-lysine,2-oxoglutarate 5-dioxygenase